MPFPEQPPQPIPPDVPRYNADGTPKRVLIDYEKALWEYLKRLAAAIP